MSPSLEIQAALRTLFKNDPTLSALIKEVYEIVPEQAPFPYIMFADGTTIPFDTKDEDGYIVTMGFQAFDQNNGSMTVRRIQSAIHQLLHGKTIQLETKTADCYQEIELPVVVQSDNRTVSSVTRYRFEIA